jgi:uncharacterized protein (DUF2235 family)
MKRIAFCADGTWDGTSNDTNVFKMFNALLISADQLTFYDSGVGADGNPIEKLLGGAFGAGLFQKIKDGYTRIAHAYEAGDEIFLFGFSRGAYTARSLAGMIANCGLPTKNFDDALIEAAFHAYRNKDQRAAILAGLGPQYGMVIPQITMVGVWDTVGSLGIPAIFGGVSPLVYGFLDTGLHPNIKNAFHAVAIDERRPEFPATMWTSAPTTGQTIDQVWFCGVHSDVGGGYGGSSNVGVSTALSDITLGWMMNKAQGLGLAVSSAALSWYSFPLDGKYALDQLHDSWNPLWGFPTPRKIADNSSLANSVVIRCQHHLGYQPGNLTLQDGVPIAGYGTVPVVTA